MKKFKSIIILITVLLNCVSVTYASSLAPNEIVANLDKSKLNTQSTDKAIEDIKIDYSGNSLPTNFTGNESRSTLSSSILLDSNFVGTSHTRGTISIPFNLYRLDSSYAGYYYVEIYNSKNEKVASKSEAIPSFIGSRKLTLNWDASQSPAGEYYIRHYSTYYQEFKNVLFPFTLEANTSEIFTSVLDGSQMAINNNLSNPLSAWKSTSATLQPYSFSDKTNYQVRLQEMLVGKEAEIEVYDENKFNNVPTSAQQWILMKYNIKNTGSTQMSTSDIIYRNNFYTRDGASLQVFDTATLSGDRKGASCSSITLYPGASSDCWIGILVNKSNGYPLLRINNGYSTTSQYSWLNTDPYYITNHTGWVERNNQWYYYNGKDYPHTGWLNLSGTWYFMNSDGVMQTGWLFKDNKYYYLNKSGAMHKGWINTDGDWYFMKSDGTMHTGWLLDNNQYYFMNKNGTMHKGWIYDGGKYYYLNNSGVMHKGWIELNNKFYYLNNDGTMHTGWRQVAGKWYYLNTDGAMRTGWLLDSNTYYYLRADGSMNTGWIQISGDWYFMDHSGKMQKNIIIDGWIIDGNGVAKPL